jgi:hypothetical protein
LRASWLRFCDPPSLTLSCCTLAQSAGRAPPLCFQRASGSRPRRTGHRDFIFHGGGHRKTCHSQQEIDYCSFESRLVFSQSFIVLKFYDSPCEQSRLAMLFRAPLLPRASCARACRFLVIVFKYKSTHLNRFPILVTTGNRFPISVTTVFTQPAPLHSIL